MLNYFKFEDGGRKYTKCIKKSPNIYYKIPTSEINSG